MYLLFSDSKTMATTVNYTCKSFIKLTPVLYCTVLYSTLLYSTVLFSTLLYSTLLYSSVFYCAVLYCTVLYCTVLYCTVLYCTVLYFITHNTRILFHKAHLYKSIRCIFTCEKSLYSQSELRTAISHVKV